MINYLFLAVALLLGSFACEAATLPAPRVAPVKFEIDGVPVSQVLRVIYSEAVKSPYVLDPSVLGDSRPVSFRYSSPAGDLKPFLVKFLGTLGYEIDQVGGVDFVRARPVVEPSLNGNADKDYFIYRPKFREGNYLVELLSPLFHGQFTARRSIQPQQANAQQSQAPSASNASPTSAAGQVDRSVDTLIFAGDSKEIAKLQKILAQVDVPGGEVLVRGVIYEVSTSENDGSAFSLAASVLNGKLSASFGPATPFSDGVLSLKNANWSAVVSALSSDSRFKIVSSPSARVRSGAEAKFVVGQDVPVLGSVSYAQGSAVPVQSVTYQSSGVIFQITPRVRDSIVDVDLSQQMSSFENTTTGVNNSPTLDKRSLDTSISVSDGDLVVLGGLTEDKSSNAETGVSFLPSFLRAKTAAKSKTEMLLLLQLTKI